MHLRAAMGLSRLGLEPCVRVRAARFLFLQEKLSLNSIVCVCALQCCCGRHCMSLRAAVSFHANTF